MIGLFDMDLVVDKMLHFPNLELMKLFAFYKKQSQPAILLNQYSDLTQCEQIFVRREKDTSQLSPFPSFPIDTDWGGSYYIKNRYKPFKNPEIEIQRPTILLYQNYIQERLLTRPKKQLDTFNFWLKSSFLRLYNGQPQQWAHITPSAPLLIYDSNIFEQDYFLLHEQICKRKPSRILYRWPVFLDTVDTFEKFIQNNMIFQNCTFVDNRFVLNFEMSYTDFRKFLIQYETVIKRLPATRLFIPLLPQKYQNNEIGPTCDYIACFEKTLQFIYYAISRGYRIYPLAVHNKNSPFNTISKIMENYLNPPEGIIHCRPPAPFFMTKAKPQYEMAVKLYPDIKPLLDVSAQQLRVGGHWYGKFRYQT